MDTTVADKINAFFSTYPKRTYKKGQILVFADESPEHIFYIVKGSVRKYDVSYRGDEVVVNVFRPPAFFPMSWAINRTPNKYFYKTESQAELHIVPVDDAMHFIKDNPDVLLDLVSRIYRGMEGLLGRVVHLMSGSAKSRLLYELIIECRRTGDKQKDGSYFLGLSEVDMAGRAGLSRETVSREMHNLKTAKLVSITTKGITVHDVNALEQKLGTAI